jgi:hypothetical protein
VQDCLLQRRSRQRQGWCARLLPRRLAAVAPRRSRSRIGIDGVRSTPPARRAVQREERKPVYEYEIYNIKYFFSFTRTPYNPTAPLRPVVQIKMTLVCMACVRRVEYNLVQREHQNMPVSLTDRICHFRLARVKSIEITFASFDLPDVQTGVK